MTLWFTKEPHALCQELGISIEPRRARELQDLFDGDIGGWYYLWGASRDGSDEASKWILGQLAAKLNELKKDWQHASYLIPPDYLAAFVEYLKAGQFERSFAKDVFAEIMNRGVQFHPLVDLHDEMTPAEVQA